MKRTYFAIASLAAILSSCSKDLVEHSSIASSNHIHFNTYLQRSNLKQTNTDLTTLQTNGFGINAFNTANTNWDNGGNVARTQILEHKPVHFVNGTWSYAPPVLWPSSDKVSFFAHSPMNQNSHFTFSNDNAIIVFTQTQSRAAQADLLVAFSLDKTKNDVNNEGKLGLTMKHVLARVGFKAKYIESPNIASVEVSDFVIKYSSRFKTTATYLLTGPASAAEGHSRSPWVNLFPVDQQVQEETIAGPIAVGTTFDYILNDINGAVTFDPTNSRNFFLLIPQNIDQGTIRVSMNITAKRKDGTVETWRISDKDLGVPLRNKIRPILLSGRAYDFTFNFNVDRSPVDPTDPQTPIDPDDVLVRFDVTQVEDWNSVGDFFIN